MDGVSVNVKVMVLGWKGVLVTTAVCVNVLVTMTVCVMVFVMMGGVTL